MAAIPPIIKNAITVPFSILEKFSIYKLRKYILIFLLKLLNNHNFITLKCINKSTRGIPTTVNAIIDATIKSPNPFNTETTIFFKVILFYSNFFTNKLIEYFIFKSIYLIIIIINIIIITNFTFFTFIF